jgi:hypothetical protein
VENSLFSISLVQSFGSLTVFAFPQTLSELSLGGLVLVRTNPFEAIFKYVSTSIAAVIHMLSKEMF